jgi:hypothetical protein
MQRSQPTDEPLAGSIDALTIDGHCAQVAPAHDAAHEHVQPENELPVTLDAWPVQFSAFVQVRSQRG